jgi:hypothetical protein
MGFGEEGRYSKRTPAGIVERLHTLIAPGFVTLNPTPLRKKEKRSASEKVTERGEIYV